MLYTLTSARVYPSITWRVCGFSAAEHFPASPLSPSPLPHTHKRPELIALDIYDAHWRDVIRDVRAIYSGELTYAGNWWGVSEPRAATFSAHHGARFFRTYA